MEEKNKGIKRKKHAHYVSNKEFYPAMVEWLNQFEENIKAIEPQIKEIDSTWTFKNRLEKNDSLKIRQKRKQINKLLLTVRPEISPYITDCFMRLSSRNAQKQNFINYTFKDDMVMEGIEHCIRYMDRFNPVHESQNPFAYFTTIITNIFKQKITREKREHTLKRDLIMNGYLETCLEAHGEEAPELQDFINSVKKQEDEKNEIEEMHKEQKKNVKHSRPKYMN